jgi:hypothetical protein
VLVRGDGAAVEARHVQAYCVSAACRVFSAPLRRMVLSSPGATCRANRLRSCRYPMRSFFGSLRRLVSSETAIVVCAFVFGALLTLAFFYLNWGQLFFLFFHLLSWIRAYTGFDF